MSRTHQQPVKLDLQSIVSKVRSGDREAFGEIFTAFERSLNYVLCRQHIPDPEDVAQDAFLTTFRAVLSGSLRNPDGLPAFLFETARRIGVDRFRRKLKQATIKAFAFEEEAYPNRKPTALDQLEAQERYARIDQALDQMKTLDREILKRFYQSGDDQREIMRDLGITKNQFRLTKSRAKAKLTASVRKREKREQMQLRAA